MKKGILLLIITFFGTNAPAQSILPATQPDLFLNRKADIINTSICFSSSYITNTVIAYDFYGPSLFIMEAMDNSGNVFFSRSYNDCFDPDVSYSHNFDRLWVTYTKTASGKTQVYLDEYAYWISGGTQGFAVISTRSMGNGNNSNIDFIDDTQPGGVSSGSDGKGMLVFENQGGSSAVQFTIPEGPFFTLDKAKEPDVAMHHNSDKTTITFVNQNGKLEIITYDFTDLLTGTTTVLNQFVYDDPGMRRIGFQEPRIASLHQSNAGSTDNFTVVSGMPDGRILGYFYDAATSTMLPNVLINSGFENCTNIGPVVAYNSNAISIAWNSDYSSSCSPYAFGGSSNDVLLKEFDLSGTPISPTGDVYEVNNTQGSYSNVSNLAIASKYDSPGLMINSASAIEGILFCQNALDLYYKSRNTGGLYKTSQQEEFNDMLLKVYPNPTSDELNIELSSKEESASLSSILISNMSGQKIFQLEDVSTPTLTVDTSSWPSGIYICQVRTGENIITHEVVKH